MDGFVTSRLPINANDAVLSMGYYTRTDLPYYYAVADAFTLCDNYLLLGDRSDRSKSSLLDGRVHRSRWEERGAAAADAGGATRSIFGKLTYTTMPEQLQARGISWKVYSSPDQNIFSGFSTPTTSFRISRISRTPRRRCIKNAFGPQFPTDFVSDAVSGNLPQVSWIIGSVIDSDHPPSPSLFGENTLSAIITALIANPAAWAKTALFATYDENGGFFDHVPPVTAPPGTAGEYITAAAVPDPTCRRLRSTALLAWVSACPC